MIPRLLQILLLLLIVYPETAAYDCLQYSKQQYTTIQNVSVCAWMERGYACAICLSLRRGEMAEWSKALVLGTSLFGGVGTNEKWSGGCSTSSDKGCRTRGDVTVCTCTGDRCNEQGYKMDSGEDEK
ncbi:unnamed protein product [Caenorhabditis auriculariae]|uniref:Uncharacterized protein n=1 Tax=Caenorhabditis auriculariae TaxID=2777116 RepID=A0A8S1HNU8_9PELO|nr:unnamed protein product [Caenorhabditis auriculariae]